MDLFQIFPLGLQVFRGLGEEGGMNEILVDVIQLQFLERELECFLGVFGLCA